MATASASSGAAVSSLLQKASQQYLECRRKVTAKVDEVTTLETEIQTLFERITIVSQSTTTAKSVGRLEISVVAVEGDAPVDDAVISIDIDPEYEEPEEKAEEETKGEEAEEAKEESDETKEEEEEGIAASEEEEKKESAEEPTEPKPAQRRTVQWGAAEGFPLAVVFDPVQSREAVVTISIAQPAVDGENSEPVKEFRIPVSSLFQTGSINRWYVLKKIEHVHVDKASITEVDDERVKPTEEPKKEEDETEKTEKAEDVSKEQKEEDEAAPPAEEQPQTEEPKSEEPKSEEPTSEEPKSEEAPQQTLVSAEASIQSTDEVHVLKEGKLHVTASFAMSEIEKLTQTAIALSQQKQEAEATLAVLEREAASLRTKYERLNASQRSLSAGSSVVKPRSTLLGGRGVGAAPVRVEKSSYQKMKDSVSAVLTPQRTQVLTSFAIFVGSVALFHFQGENLLA